MKCCKSELPLLNGESLEITSTVPLSIKKYAVIIVQIFLQFPIYCEVELD